MSLRSTYCFFRSVKTATKAAKTATKTAKTATKAAKTATKTAKTTSPPARGYGPGRDRVQGGLGGCESPPRRATDRRVRKRTGYEDGCQRRAKVGSNVKVTGPSVTLNKEKSTTPIKIIAKRGRPAKAARPKTAEVVDAKNTSLAESKADVAPAATEHQAPLPENQPTLKQDGSNASRTILHALHVFKLLVAPFCTRACALVLVRA